MGRKQFGLSLSLIQHPNGAPNVAEGPPPSALGWGGGGGGRKLLTLYLSVHPAAQRSHLSPLENVMRFPGSTL